LCMHALQTRADGRQVNEWKGFGPFWEVGRESVTSLSTSD